MIKSDNYLNIQGWMRTELELKTTELMVYAIIYGFSQDGHSEFRGSAGYIADWIGVDKKTVRRVLKKLTDDGIILRREVHLENGVTYNCYKANRTKCLGGGQNVQGGWTKCLGGGQNVPQAGQNVQGGWTKCLGGMDKMSTNNNKYNSNTYSRDKKPPNRFHNFPQREYDYDTLEEMLQEAKDGN